MRIWTLSVVSIACKAAKCKEKTLMCAQNHQKKAAVVGTLVRKFRGIFISKSSLHIARASSRRCIAQRSNCADRTASFR